MADPLVTVLIDSYNYGRFVEQAVDSALAQTYGHVEVVVVDDGSTDDTLCRLEGYGDAITVIAQDNGGQAAAFNAGFAAARGEWIMLLDADDLLHPDAASAVVATVRGGRAAKAHYRLQAVDETGRPLGFTSPAAGRALADGDVADALARGATYSTPVTSGTAYHRAALEQIGPIPADRFRIAADGFLSSAAPFFGPVAAVPGILGSYRIHGANQWTGAVDGATLARFVAHDQHKHEVIRDMARRTGRRAVEAPGRLDHAHQRARLASLRVNGPGHPIPGDSTLGLGAAAVRATILAADLNLVMKAKLAIWTVALALSPRSLVPRLLQRMYAPRAGRRG